MDVLTHQSPWHSNAVGGHARQLDRIQGQRSHPVQRSVSLQPSRRPDRNNNGHGNGCGGANSQSVGNFELANLLARGASFDAKFLRQLNEFDETIRRTSRTSLDADPPRSGQLQGDVGLVELPLRYRVLLRLGGGSRRGSTAAAGTGGAADVREEQETSSYSGVLRPHLDVEGISLDERERDLGQTLQWLKQEIRSLKQQDRALMRSLLELGTIIHRHSGALQETISCQTVNEGQTSYNLHRIDDHSDADDSDQSSQNYQESPTSMSSLDDQYRAVSTTAVNHRPNVTKKTNSSSKLSRLISRFLPSRSVDQIYE